MDHDRFHRVVLLVVGAVIALYITALIIKIAASIALSL